MRSIYISCFGILSILFINQPLSHAALPPCGSIEVTNIIKFTVNSDPNYPTPYYAAIVQFTNVNQTQAWGARFSFPIASESSSVLTNTSAPTIAKKQNVASAIFLRQTTPIEFDVQSLIDGLTYDYCMPYNPSRDILMNQRANVPYTAQRSQNLFAWEDVETYLDFFNRVLWIPTIEELRSSPNVPSEFYRVGAVCPESETSCNEDDLIEEMNNSSISLKKEYSPSP